MKRIVITDSSDGIGTAVLWCEDHIDSWEKDFLEQAVSVILQ